MYYGVDEQANKTQQENPLDIDGGGFKKEQYVEKLLKECSLTELYERERIVKKGVHYYY